MSITHLHSQQPLLRIKQLMENYLNGESLKETLEEFLALIVETTKSEHGFIGMYETQNNLASFKTAAISKLLSGEEQQLLYDQHGKAGLTLEQLQQYFGPIEISSGPLHFDEKISDAILTYAGIPIDIAGRALGYIGVINKKSHYDVQDFKTLGLIRDSIYAVINASLHNVGNDERSQSNRNVIALEESGMGFWEWVNEGLDNNWKNTQQEWWSPKFYDLLGYENNEIPANLNTFVALIHPEDIDVTFNKFSTRSVGKEYDEYDIKHRLRCKNGQYRWFRSKGKLFKKEGHVVKMVGSIRDIHKEYELMKSLNYKASHDELTGLPNRASFLAEVAKLVKQPSDSTHVIAIIDIEQLNIINNLHGNEVGDQAIQLIATFIGERLRKRDVIARIGGDEFGVIIKDCGINKAEIILNAIVANLELEQVVIHGREVKLGIFAGLSILDAAIDDYEQAISYADSACNQTKQGNCGRIKVYDASDSQIIDHQQKLSWVNRVRSAIKEKNIKLFVQPIVRVKSKAVMERSPIRHFEVLTRIQENNEFISPNEFMPTVEGFRLSSEYDRYLINQFCNWYREHKNMIPLQTRFSINLSGQSITDQRILELIVRNVNAFSIPPEVICLEITETAAINNMAHAKSFIDTLRMQGLRFSLDDFGQGLSSFSYLKELPVDFLKIDGQFIKNLKKDSKNYSIVQSINRVGKTIGYSTVAECVEDEQSLDIIRELDIDFVQGYLFGKPILIDEIFNTYLLQGQRNPSSIAG